MPAEIIEWTKLLISLGLAVWQAVQSGDRSKTVGEIFDGVPRDEDTIRRLREEARKHYEVG